MRAFSLQPRILFRAALALSFLLLVAVIAIHVQQQVLRRRAERLLVDIRTLDLRKTTFAEAQTVFRRWSSWGRYEGECKEESCAFEVTLQDFSYNHRSIFYDRPWLYRPYMFVGGRPAQVHAGISVRNGIVWAKSFYVTVEVPPRGSPGWDYEYGLIGDAQTVSRFTWGANAGLKLHPNYVVDRPGGCTGCLAVYALFTPYADREDIKRLMQFDLSCLTRWRPCREQGDIMPAAWAEHLAEEPRLQRAYQDHTCSLRTVQLLGRDAENAAIIEVVANRQEGTSHGETFQVSTVRLTERLKRTGFWNVGTSRDVRVFRGTVALTHLNTPSEVRPGGRFIILFAHRSEGPDMQDIWLEQCGAVPLNEPNLAMLRRGIDQDFLAAEPNGPGRTRR